MDPITCGHGLDELTAGFYRNAMEALERSGVPFLLGGAYAFAQYTGIARHTKDLDVFLRRQDAEPALEALQAAGFETERSFPHWLAKARSGELFVDLIYGSGNGVAIVDEDWFTHAQPGTSFGKAVMLIPPEEMIWSKAFVQERERYDGADVIHLLKFTAERIDWSRLLRRFGARWRVLLSYLLLFGFVYPGRRHTVPEWVVRSLLERLESELEAPTNGDQDLCQGTMLSREQYRIDIAAWGHEDARRRADCAMTDDDIRLWTEAIDAEERRAS